MHKKKIAAKVLTLALATAMVVPATSIIVKAEATTQETTVQSAEQSEYTYVYAGLTWKEFWENEAVYEAGNDTASAELDSRNEADKGGFDVVSRATVNHGIHRGSFQGIATIETEEGRNFELAGWDGSSTMILTDGTTVQFEKGTITDGDKTYKMKDYRVYGLKYVPVAVKNSDYADFCKNYKVVENGGKLFGGYGEGSLKSYELYAAVDANTNGLKTAEKQSDGSFKFSARKTDGTDSGVKDQADATTQAPLKKADPQKITLTVKPGDGTYGEFLRVDLTGDAYGELGSFMQSVTWNYYGTDATRTKALATYGTKFASDNWMHKSMGIQLGLTDSIRCKLPEGTDGTGYWSIRISALGYEDAAFDFEVKGENLASFVPVQDETLQALKAKVEEAQNWKKDDYTRESFAAMEAELEEAKEVLAKDRAEISQGVAEEALSHLTDAQNGLIKKSETTITIRSKSAVYTGKTITIAPAKVSGSTADVRYTYYSDRACTKEIKAPKYAGIYYVKATVEGTDTATAAESKVAKLTIQKAQANITIKVPAKSLKSAALKKKAQSFQLSASADSKGKITYKKVSGSRVIALDKNGKVTVAKGTKKGSYRIKINVSAAEKRNYKAATISTYVRVVVR